MGKQFLSPQTHLRFRTTSIYPPVSAPKGIRRILHGPRSTVKRRKRGKGDGGWEERSPGSLSWLGVVEGAATLLFSSLLSRGDPRRGASLWATGTRLGKDMLESLQAKTFRPLAATLQERPPFRRPQVVPLPAQPPAPRPGPSEPGSEPPGAGGGGGSAASPRQGARQPPVPGTQRCSGRAAPPRRAGAELRRLSAASGGGASSEPSRAGAGRRAPAPPPLSLLLPASLLPCLPPSPSQNTQCRNVPKMTSERSRIPCLSAAAAEGTGKKQQEGRAMATLDRKVPSPEAFLGKPWSSWIDAAKLHCSDSKNPTASSSFYYPVTFPFT